LSNNISRHLNVLKGVIAAYLYFMVPSILFFKVLYLFSYCSRFVLLEMFSFCSLLFYAHIVIANENHSQYRHMQMRIIRRNARVWEWESLLISQYRQEQEDLTNNDNHSQQLWWFLQLRIIIN